MKRTDELAVFLLICVVLFPVLTVGIMGLYGLAVWISHMLGT
jgi:nitrate reductase NapE component